MIRSITSSLYKLFIDRPFRVTMIVGIILALGLTFVYNMTDDGVTGSLMLLMTGSPTNNFGIAIPINLVTFIIGEYTYGTIRNKIIAGNRRRNIYISLLISNIIFSLLLITAYSGLSVILGTILGGWGTMEAKEVLSYILITVLVYILLAALATLMATLIRHQGLAITATILIIFSGFITAMIYFSVNGGHFNDSDYALFAFNPLSYHALSSLIITSFFLSPFKALPWCAISCVLYSALFVGLGLYFFHRFDVK